MWRILPNLSKRPYRECAESLHLYGDGEKPELIVRQDGEVRHVLDYCYFLFQKNCVNGAAQVLDVVYVVRIDSYQYGSAIG